MKETVKYDFASRVSPSITFSVFTKMLSELLASPFQIDKVCCPIRLLLSRVMLRVELQGETRVTRDPRC